MKNVLEMLEESSKKYPDKVAFSDPEKKVTFAKLKERAQKIASLFVNGSICPPLKMEEGVAFFMEKDTDAVCAMFAAVYAGCFYSFIDVRQPGQRVEAVLDILSPALIITDDENMEKLPAVIRKDYPVIKIAELTDRACQSDIADDILKKIRMESNDCMPLYVNFTSGSTGTPKGVAVGHRSVIDFTEVFTDTFGIESSDILANQAPFDFDVSVKDIYSGLYRGAGVVLIPRDYFSNPAVLMDYLSDNEVTILVWAVSALCFVSIMNGLEYKTPQKIRQVMFSGEVMPVKQLNKWRKFLPDARYVNLYGPTEITCNCLYYILDREFENNEEIPAGIPFDNEKVFLLDENDRLVTKADQRGEICVGGTCLALGYYKDREKTDRVFTLNPLNDRYYERIYRTGDIGKFDKYGNILYVSRKDFQIKHMGQRIELGEIETCAVSLEGVSRSCCLYDQKRKRIELFYTGDIGKDEVISGLQEKLPQFMIPGRTVRLSDFPLNKNGKIDRKGLENGEYKEKEIK